MRRLNSQTDLDDLAPHLRIVVERCLQRWSDAAGPYVADPYVPDQDVVLLVEPGDSMDDLIGFSSLLESLLDPDDLPPFEWVSEWVSDLGICFEAAVILGEGGFSLIVPKADGIPIPLLAACIDLATPEPVEP